MIPKECKRLAEVDFPIGVVSKHSAREKSIRHGHSSTLHLWWARRPLAACRAMLLGLLLPDPCDMYCPKEFKTTAEKALLGVPGWNTEKRKQQVQSEEGLRRALLDFIGDVSDWDVANDPRWIGPARELIKAAHPEETPLVVDPFAGGGSIPLEALRLSCDAFASDLNPVACLILKVMLGDIPRHGPELAEELRRAGSAIKNAAEKELAEFYPKDPDGAIPIAYLWSRTVRCESPNCGAEIPLARSFWLCKKADRKQALRYSVVRPKNDSPRVEFEIFEPKSGSDVPQGTVTRGNATCLCCNMVLPVDRVRAQLAQQRGGADVVFDDKGNRTGGARILAAVTLHQGMQGRNYRVPTEHDYEAVWKAQKRLKAILDEWERPGKKGLCPVPDEPTPAGGGSGAGRAFSVQKYGMMKFGDLFTARQKVELVYLTQAIAHAVMTAKEPLALCMSKMLETNCNLCPWEPVAECPRTPFRLGALPPSWDFAEAVAISNSSGGFLTVLDNVTRALDAIGNDWASTLPQIADARDSPLSDEAAAIYFTDPPYYDAIPYSELSDFFFVWLKRSLRGHRLMQDPFDAMNPLTPNYCEIVQDETKEFQGHPRDKEFFEGAMTEVFTDGRRILSLDGIGSIIFAHKTTEGWEALLSGIIRGGWLITASWPVATELSYRQRARDSAALATSVHLVCRPRPDDAPVGDWGEVLRELPKRVGDWMERLQSEGIRGADLVFACVGPALEIFSRYSKVETAEGREVQLDEYLMKVWEVVGRTALEQVLGPAESRPANGTASALEEDARLTALFLWTLQTSNGQNQTAEKKEEEADEESVEEDEESAPASRPRGYSLIFDVVRRFAQPLGINLPKWEGRIIKTEKGIVRLLPVADRAKQLFGEDGATTVADWIERKSANDFQQVLFPELEERAPKIRSHRRRARIDISASGEETLIEATTLDRVHAAMLLQASGKTNALRALIKAEQQRGPDFMRLANALSALYPRGSEEKRLIDAMLLVVPR